MPCSACAPCVIDPRGLPWGTLQCSPLAHHQHRILGFGCRVSQTRVLLSPSWVSFPSIFMAPPVQSAGFVRLCCRGRWTQTVLFQAIPAWGSPSPGLGRNLWSPKPWQKQPSPPWQSSRAGFVVCWDICSFSKGQVLPAHSLYVVVYF